MSRSSYNNSNHQPHLYRENSLPTYEEATGQVQKSVPALIAGQPIVIHNVNEFGPYNDELIPIHQPRSQRHIHTSSRRDVEAGLEQSARYIPRHEDPAIAHRVAQTALRERRARGRRREDLDSCRTIGLACALFSVITTVILVISSLASKQRFFG